METVSKLCYLGNPWPKKDVTYNILSYPTASYDLSSEDDVDAEIAQAAKVNESNLMNI